MAAIQIQEKVIQKIRTIISGSAKLLLDYDDGVGPYSQVGSCSIGTDFNLLAVEPDAKVPDYNARFTSQLGPIYYKSYSARYLDSELKLTLGSFNQIELSGKNGMIDGSVSLVDERKKK